MEKYEEATLEIIHLGEDIIVTSGWNCGCEGTTDCFLK